MEVRRMGKNDVKVKDRTYLGETPEDKKSTLRVFSEAMAGKPSGAERTVGSIHAQPESDGSITVTTPSGQDRWKKETIQRVLEENTRDP